MAADTLAMKIYGAESILSPAVTRYGVESSAAVDALVGNSTYIITTLVFAAIYLVWLPFIVKNRGVRWSQIGRRAHNVDQGQRDVVSHQQIGVELVTWLLSIVFVSLFTLRVVAEYWGEEIAFMWDSLLILTPLSIVGVIIYEWSLLKASGYLTLQTEFVERLLSLKRQFLFFLVIFISPLVILASLTNFITPQLIVQLPVLLVVVHILLFIRQSFLLFTRQNFSILHWFLYLCAIEIFPLTFLSATAVRGCVYGN